MFEIFKVSLILGAILYYGNSPETSKFFSELPTAECNDGKMWISQNDLVKKEGFSQEVLFYSEPIDC